MPGCWDSLWLTGVCARGGGGGERRVGFSEAGLERFGDGAPCCCGRGDRWRSAGALIMLGAGGPRGVWRLLSVSSAVGSQAVRVLPWCSMRLWFFMAQSPPGDCSTSQTCASGHSAPLAQLPLFQASQIFLAPGLRPNVFAQMIVLPLTWHFL